MDESRLDNLRDEIKLLKGELKNSLASVRDYLLNMELPSSEFSTILAALSGDNPNSQKLATGDMADKGEDIPEPDFDEEKPAEDALNEMEQPGEDEDLLDFEDPNKEEETSEEIPDEGALEDMAAEDELPSEDEEVLEELPEDEALETEEEELPEEEEELVEPEAELPPDDLEYANSINEALQGTPKVNMLANLISWVAKAKQDIGSEDLPAFLEVYGISGHLSPELKEVILRLAEMTKDLPDNTADSEIWGQSMLSLHGILTGGDAPLNPVIPSWVDSNDGTDASLEDEIIEIGKANKSAKLKLVLPTDNGESKEFCIDLTPEDNGNGAA
jgi:hypothetical protein